MNYKGIALGILIALLIGAGPITVDADQSTSASVRGAWRITHSTEVGGKNRTDFSRPSLFVFTERHYSLITVNAERPRYQSPQEATPEQKVATFDAVSANAGTYEVKGNKLIMTRQVAKNLHIEGSRQEVEARIEGKTLILVYPDGGSFTLTRLE